MQDGFELFFFGEGNRGWSLVVLSCFCGVVAGVRLLIRSQIFRFCFAFAPFFRKIGEKAPLRCTTPSSALHPLCPRGPRVGYPHGRRGKTTKRGEIKGRQPLHPSLRSQKRVIISSHTSPPHLPHKRNPSHLQRIPSTLLAVVAGFKFQITLVLAVEKMEFTFDEEYESSSTTGVYSSRERDRDRERTRSREGDASRERAELAPSSMSGFSSANANAESARRQLYQQSSYLAQQSGMASFNALSSSSVHPSHHTHEAQAQAQAQLQMHHQSRMLRQSSSESAATFHGPYSSTASVSASATASASAPLDNDEGEEDWDMEVTPSPEPVSWPGVSNNPRSAPVPMPVSQMFSPSNSNSHHPPALPYSNFANQQTASPTSRDVTLGDAHGFNGAGGGGNSNVAYEATTPTEMPRYYANQQHQQHHHHQHHHHHVSPSSPTNVLTPRASSSFSKANGVGTGVGIGIGTAIRGTNGSNAPPPPPVSASSTGSASFQDRSMNLSFQPVSGPTHGGRAERRPTNPLAKTLESADDDACEEEFPSHASAMRMQVPATPRHIQGVGSPGLLFHDPLPSNKRHRVGSSLESARDGGDGMWSYSAQGGVGGGGCGGGMGVGSSGGGGGGNGMSGFPGSGNITGSGSGGGGGGHEGSPASSVVSESLRWQTPPASPMPSGRSANALATTPSSLPNTPASPFPSMASSGVGGGGGAAATLKPGQGFSMTLPMHGLLPPAPSQPASSPSHVSMRTY